MVFSIILLMISAGVAIFLFRLISQNKVTSINTLSKRKQALEARYDYLLENKWDLQAKLSQKEKQLQTLINNSDGIRIKTAAQTPISEDEMEDKISTYLIASGKISLEQDHKIRREMSVLRMNYLSTGVTLGLIDLKISEQLTQGNWISDK